jgi:excisionase family DNA binding protein
MKTIKKPPELERYIRVTEAAERTGIDRAFFYHAIYAKKIPFIVTNPYAKRPTYMIKQSGLEQYLASIERRKP